MTHVKYSSKPLLINFGAFEYLALHFGKAIETLAKYEIGLTKRSFGEIKKSNQKIFSLVTKIAKLTQLNRPSSIFILKQNQNKQTAPKR